MGQRRQRRLLHGRCVVRAGDFGGVGYVHVPEQRFRGAPVPGRGERKRGAGREHHSNGGWYVYGQTLVGFGANGDIPVPADYDHDGDDDRAVWRPSSGGWYVYAQTTIWYGQTGDTPVPADYDGDGDADRALYRNGSWLIYGQSSFTLGNSSDTPLPANYDNTDTHAEAAVWTPATGTWTWQAPTGSETTSNTYIWDPLAPTGIPELALERTPAAALVRRYQTGPTGALSLTSAAGTYWYHADPLGTVTDLTDSTGAAQWRYDYEPYGAPRTATDITGGAPVNPFRFNGQHLDPDTAHYHLRARQLDAASGRFGALDPIENPILEPYGAAYAYVNGRPTLVVDPLGLWGWNPLKDIGNAAAGIADGATGGLSTSALHAAGIRPDTDSIAFRAGQVGGTIAGVASGGGIAVKLGGRAVSRYAFAGTAARYAGWSAAGTGQAVGRGYAEGTPLTPSEIADALASELTQNAAGGIAARCLRPLARSRGFRFADDASPSRPEASDPKLRNALADDYRGGPNPVGDGSALDAAKHTARTGELVGGSTHLEKAVEMRNRYARILRRGGLDANDEAVARQRYDAYLQFVEEHRLDEMMKARGLQ